MHVISLPFMYRLLDATKGMLDKDAFAQMKDGVVILNFARDTLVDEEAYVNSYLKSGKVKKYVTDFPNTTTAGIKMPYRNSASWELPRRNPRTTVRLWQ